MNTSPPNSSLFPQRGHRVLVVDDDDVARETMVELLLNAGHQVFGLPSPIGATKHILDGDIEVVVLDVMMPSIRGDKLAVLLGRNPRLRHLGVILVTGAPLAEVDVVAGAVRASAVVEKSAVHTDLDAAVRRAVRIPLVSHRPSPAG